MPCGYDRVSTLDRDLSIQLDALTAAGCTVARSKEVSRTTTDGVRSPLLELMHEGEW
jgi:DNA invertase Pin-like site-specific DNA recombinase